jgi:hypothetical protein
MVVRTQQFGAFKTDRAIAEGGSFGTAGDNSNVLGHGFSECRSQIVDFERTRPGGEIHGFIQPEIDNLRS